MQNALLVCAALALQDAPPELQPDDLRGAGRMAGLVFDEPELDLMLNDVAENLAAFEALRAIPLANATIPALVFDPLLPGIEAHAHPIERAPIRLPEVERPDDLAELAYADVPTLAALIRSRQVTSLELTELALARLVALDPKLFCVVTLTAERARAQAAALDDELARGHWRGLLHGIPWGAKDLLAVRGAPTTWGSPLFRAQTFDRDATVVERLDAAGAVLVAKLSLGELAMGDVWYGGTTRNPWSLEQGSSGSSAGSAAAVAAGCVPFAIGSETLGSIVSPSVRCGATGLRPTFGRVSRDGAMTLSWSMDKLGVLARSALDAAIVLAEIHGPDGRDPTVHDLPFAPSAPVDVTGWRVGYPKDAFVQTTPAVRKVIEDLEALGVELVEVELPDYPAEALLTILAVEAATAFDELTRTGRDEEMVRQVAQAWPNVFRTAQTVPAVEYLRANRVRTEMMRDVSQALAGLRAVVHPPYGGGFLRVANLTGQPSITLPCGFRDDGTPEAVTFTGRLFGEEALLGVAEAWQASTDHHRRHPDL